MPETCSQAWSLEHTLEQFDRAVVGDDIDPTGQLTDINSQIHSQLKTTVTGTLEFGGSVHEGYYGAMVGIAF